MNHWQRIIRFCFVYANNNNNSSNSNNNSKEENEIAQTVFIIFCRSKHDIKFTVKIALADSPVFSCLQYPFIYINVCCEKQGVLKLG